MKRRLLHIMLVVRLWWLESRISPRFNVELSRTIDRLIVRLEDLEVRK